MPVGFKRASSQGERNEPSSDLDLLQEILASSEGSESGGADPAAGVEREVGPEHSPHGAGEAYASVKGRMKDLASYLLPAASPANDDKESIGALVRAIERKHNRAPELTALAATCFWLLMCVVFIRGESSRLVGGGLLNSEAIIIVLAVTGFVFAFFLLTGVAIRARDTQATVRALTKLVASGLEDGSIAPTRDDGAALERLTRIEKSIEAAYARAEKLGSSYQNDCAKFEKAVSQSEARLKKIIEELSVERASVVTSAEKLRFSISGSHNNFSNDLEAATAKLEKLIDGAGIRVVGEITGKTEEIARFAQQAEEKTATHLRAAFESTLLRATERLEEVNTRFAANLSSKGAELEGRLSNRLREATLVFERQAEDVQQKSCARVEDVTAQVTRLLDRMNIALSDRSDTLKAALAEKLVEIAQTFREGSVELSKELEKVVGIADRLSSVTSVMNENTSEQIVKLNDEVVAPLRTITASLGAESFQFVRKYLDELSSFDRRLLENSRRASVLIDGSLSDFQGALDKTVDRFARANQRSSNELLALVDQKTKGGEVARPAASRIAAPASVSARAIGAPVPPPAGANESKVPTRTRSENASVPPAEAEARAGAAPVVTVQAAEPAGKAEPAPAPAKSWISELLERASVDDRSGEGRAEPPSAAGTADGKATISSLFGAADRLFQSDRRLRQAWDDFRGGKPNAFADIYTGEGAVLKQRVREKLGADGELRKSIDGYTREFEDLLVKAYNGTDDETFLSFITTDAGKIYTVLADVSGRLDIPSSSLRSTVPHDR